MAARGAVQFREGSVHGFQFLVQVSLGGPVTVVCGLQFLRFLGLPDLDCLQFGQFRFRPSQVQPGLGHLVDEFLLALFTILAQLLQLGQAFPENRVKLQDFGLCGLRLLHLPLLEGQVRGRAAMVVLQPPGPPIVVFQIRLQGPHLFPGLDNLLTQGIDFPIPLHDQRAVPVVEACRHLFRQRVASGHGACLARQMLDRHLEVPRFPANRGEARPHVRQPALGGLLAQFDAVDPGRFLDGLAPAHRVRVEQGIGMALPNQAEGALRQSIGSQQFPNLPQQDPLSVQLVFAVAVPESRAPHREFRGVGRQHVGRLVDADFHFRQIARLRPVEGAVDQIRRTLDAQGRGGLFPQDPGQPVHDIALAAAIGSHQHRDPGRQPDFRLAPEGLEPLEQNGLQFHPLARRVFESGRLPIMDTDQSGGTRDCSQPIIAIWVRHPFRVREQTAAGAGMGGRLIFPSTTTGPTRRT